MDKNSFSGKICSGFQINECTKVSFAGFGPVKIANKTVVTRTEIFPTVAGNMAHSNRIDRCGQYVCLIIDQLAVVWPRIQSS
jgi:hypothetical protein